MELLDKDTAEKIKYLLKEKNYSPIVEELSQKFTNDEIEKTKASFLKIGGPFDGFGTIYRDGFPEAQLNYQYVFVSIIEDGKVAVVGKTSFWDTRRVEGSIDSSEKYNLGDLYRPYSTKNSNPTAKAIIAHYDEKNELVSDVNEKITYAVIIPIDNSKFHTEEYKTHQHSGADIHTHTHEKNIGKLVLDAFGILNSNSHEL
ncbi:hypothetical protein [Leuconostoc lactis]|uniref:hypothetical protein n=1 Tax=Leuconostoc lactis TaxID=1246 RepID=UPI0006DCD80E|nr:hypothetical protein [Leuconostoc lactis]KQB82422.1 hypothetical protein AN225_02885 [Leuconostoc lactis]